MGAILRCAADPRKSFHFLRVPDEPDSSCRSVLTLIVPRKTSRQLPGAGALEEEEGRTFSVTGRRSRERLSTARHGDYDHDQCSFEDYAQRLAQ